MTNLTPTQQAAVSWLTGPGGYQPSDIAYHQKRTPKFSTKDGKAWEPKLARGGVVQFTRAQLDALHSHAAEQPGLHITHGGETFVLILDSPDAAEATVIPVFDIKAPGWHGRYRIHLAQSNAQERPCRLDPLPRADYRRFAAAARSHGLTEARYIRALVELDERTATLVADGARPDGIAWLARERREAGL